MRLSIRSIVPPLFFENSKPLLVVAFIVLFTMMSGILGNPFLLLALTFLFTLFPSSIFMRHSKLWVYVKRVPIKVKAGMAGTICALLITFFLWSIETVIILDFMTVNKILVLDPVAIISLSAMIVAVQGLHLVLYDLHKKSIAYQSGDLKFIFYACGLATIVILCGLQPQLILIYAAGYIVYSLLLDLFIEEEKANLIWLILWTLVLGSFLSMSIVQGTNAHLASHMDKIPLMNAFTLFSLIFIISGVIYSLYGLVNQGNHILPKEWDFNFSNTLLLRNRIQLSILLTLIFSFIAIGMISLYHFKLISPANPFDLSQGFTQALLNTYVFLFLIGFSISFSLQQYIRNPLIELGRTLKEVKLTKTNRKLSWTGKDEIGNLIKEYNAMIEKLEMNASLLAQVERGQRMARNGKTSRS